MKQLDAKVPETRFIAEETWWKGNGNKVMWVIMFKMVNDQQLLNNINAEFH